jgi:MFS family permease
MLLMFFETIPKRQRLRLLTIYNVGNSVAMVAGSLLGAAMLQAWGGGRQAYWLLFVLSSAARAASLLLLQVRDRRAAGTLPMSRAATPVVARAAGINALPSPRSSAPVPLNDAA